MSIETLADMKRKMTFGSKWRCVRLLEGGGDLGMREIGKVRGNTMAFLKPDGRLLQLQWPKAKDVQVGENVFIVLQDGMPKLKYIYAGWVFRKKSCKIIWINNPCVCNQGKPRRQRINKKTIEILVRLKLQNLY